jgi:hypothetical protein
MQTETIRNWKSKKDRKDAATEFLKQVVIDPDVRSSALKDRRAAHRLLGKIGEINVPDDIEVICIGPSTQERDRLVVFILPPEGTEPEHLDVFKYWIGTWVPYGPGALPLVHNKLLETSLK